MRVLNKRTDSTDRLSTYVGRPTKWGNPFVIGRDGDRNDVVAKYEKYARAKFTKEELGELIGRNLVCWCAPKACHADVLVKLVSEEWSL